MICPTEWLGFTDRGVIMKGRGYRSEQLNTILELSPHPPENVISPRACLSN